MVPLCCNPARGAAARWTTQRDGAGIGAVRPGIHPHFRRDLVIARERHAAIAEEGFAGIGIRARRLGQDPVALTPRAIPRRPGGTHLVVIEVIGEEQGHVDSEIARPQFHRFDVDLCPRPR